MDVGMMMMVFASYGWDDCSDPARVGRGNPPGAAPLYEVSERGLKLFAKEVLPALKAQASAEVEAAAE